VEHTISFLSLSRYINILLIIRTSLSIIIRLTIHTAQEADRLDVVFVD